MSSNSIKSFSVYGLFGTYDVNIQFLENVKILIGENGLGKTQVLNLFYYTLTKDFFRLNEFNFKKLELKFTNGKTIEITKRSIEELVKETYKHPMVREVIEKIGTSQFSVLRNQFLSTSKKDRYQLEEKYEILFRKQYRLPFHLIFRAFEELEMGKAQTSNPILEKCKKDIDVEIGKVEIMYFPTFRRVEEDLHNLGYNENELHLNQENTLIQFGMDDVQKRFNQIENTIDKLLKEGLAQFTKDIIDVVIDEKTSNTNILDKISENDIDIILSRVGNSLSQNQKDAVKNIVAKKQIKNPLSAYLLQKLIDIYEKQKELDNSVKIFRDVCNKYLINKKVFYDESAIKIYIKSDITGEEISLSKLSSGEKQIISIFSKIYLSEPNKRFIVLFDEPELSLSMTWQKNLLPDITNSKKCDFLLAVTHSPFIFDNDLDINAVGINEYITPLNVSVSL